MIAPTTPQEDRCKDSKAFFPNSHIHYPTDHEPSAFIESLFLLNQTPDSANGIGWQQMISSVKASYNTSG